MTFAGEIPRFPLALGRRLVKDPQTFFPYEPINKQTPRVLTSTLGGLAFAGILTPRNAHPCGARSEVPRKRGGSVSEFRLLWLSRRENIPNHRRPRAPLGHFRALAGWDIAAHRLRPRELELASWARRSCNTTRLRSSKGFGIPGTLPNESHRATCRRGSLTARMDRFSLRGHLDASASLGRELKASSQ